MVLSKKRTKRRPSKIFSGKIKMSVELLEFVLSVLMLVLMLCQPKESVFGLKVKSWVPSEFKSCRLDLLITCCGRSFCTDRTISFLLILVVPLVSVT